MVVDTSPPALTGQAVEVKVRLTPRTTLQGDWTNVFADQESGMCSNIHMLDDILNDISLILYESLQ